MACVNCNFLGVRIDLIYTNNKENKVVKMCPYCQDLAAYSKYVQEMYSKVPTLIVSPENKKDSTEDSECQVFDFVEYYNKKHNKKI